MAFSEHLALDGSSVHINVPVDSLVPDYTSTASTSIGRGEHFLCAGLAGHAEEVAREADFGLVNFEQELSVSGARLRVGWSDLVDTGGVPYFSRDAKGQPQPTLRWFAAWIGVHSSLHLQTMGHAQADYLVDLVSRLGIQEETSGLTIPVAPLEDVEVSKWVPEVGVLDVKKMSKKVADRLPRWQGTPASGGELFVGDDEDHHSYFVIANTTTVTYVLPRAEWVEDEEAFLGLVSEIRCDWLEPATEAQDLSISRVH